MASSCDKPDRLDYSGKVILAPMVRIGTLPTRLLALQYGADIVYTEEIIDHKILGAQRIENKVLNTIDYVLSDSTLVFRTHPSEKKKLVFQLGTAKACTALQAAKKIEQDVSGIDVNMGCPKEFSLKGGMGAALLKKPETIKEILTTLVNGVSIPVTCKIRLLPELEDSISLVKLIESTGVAAIGIHGRQVHERPQHPNRNATIKALVRHINIPVIANGGSREIQTYEDIEKFRVATGGNSVMIARAAEWNTSIFRKQGILPVFDVVREYLKIAIETDNGCSNTKYCILNLMHVDMDKHEGLATQESKCFEGICEIWGLTEYMKQVQSDHASRRQAIDRHHGIKKRKADDGNPLIEMPVRFIKKDYPVGVSPKQKLYGWCQKNEKEKAVYVTTERKEDRTFKCVVQLDKAHYTASHWEKSKQRTEQAAVIVACTVLDIHDGSKPGTQSPNDTVTNAWRQHFHGNQHGDGLDDHDAIYRHKLAHSDRSESDHKSDRSKSDATKSSCIQSEATESNTCATAGNVVVLKCSSESQTTAGDVNGRAGINYVNSSVKNHGDRTSSDINVVTDTTLT